MEHLLRLVALIGAAAHVFFFYKEAVAWNVEFVAKAAPSWIRKAGGSEQAKPYVDWAENLAFNMGSYNLLLAVGLAWIAMAGSAVAGTLGLFLAICLLGAAAAAAKTG